MIFSARINWSVVARMNDRILAGDEVDLDARVEHVAQRDQNFIRIVLLRGVGQIKRLHRKVFKVGALGAVVLRDKNRVAGNRLPERPRKRADNPQRVGQRNAGQVHRNALRRIVRIEQHIQPGSLANRLVNHLHVLDHVQRDRVVRHRLQHHRRPQESISRCTSA